MTPRLNQASRTVTLTPLGAWHAARLKLLARLGERYKVAPDSPEFEPVTFERLEF